MATLEPTETPRTKNNLFKLRKSFLVIVILVLVLLAFLLYFVPRAMESERLETIDIGNEIVKALDSYMSANHRYPESIGLLAKVSKPKLGKEWVYKPSKNGQKYELLTGHKKRDGSFGPALYFKSGNSEWQYFDQDDSIEFP